MADDTKIPEGKLAVRPNPSKIEGHPKVLRDPRTKRELPAEGGLVPDSTFWRRRVRGGDVELLQDEDWAKVQKKREAEAKAKREQAAKEKAKSKGEPTGKDSESAGKSERKG